MTRLIFLSDTHGRHLNVTVPPGDILVFAGDWSRWGDVADTRSFLNWFAALPHQHKVLVAGNHDQISDENPALFVELLREWAPKVHYLQDSGVTLEGLRFWGSAVTPTFMDWYHMRARGADIKRHWDMIPDGTDVLVTHGPPRGYHDWSDYGKEHCGCDDLLEAVKRVRPKVHVMGHIHGARGSSVLTHASDRCTLMFGASVCNEGYAPVNPPHVLDL